VGGSAREYRLTSGGPPAQSAVNGSDQTDAVVAIVRETLGDAALAAYLHGSAVLGGLQPSSDLDVLVVSSRPLSADERRRLVDRLLDVSGRRARLGPARPVELTVVEASEVKPWRYPPRVDFQYGEWLRDEYERGVVPEPREDPGLAVFVSQAVAGNRTLFGPPVAELLEVVPPTDVRRAIVDGIPGLLDELETDTRNVILTLVRIWFTLGTGTIASKAEAAAWAIERLPRERRTALERARAMYLGDVPEADDPETAWGDLRASLRDDVDEILAAIELAGRTR
jgi:streptomycin 3"-adenylyltransferase